MVPKFLNRRFALVTGLTILSAVALAPKASAQSENFNFGPLNNPLTCTLTVNSPGVLAFDGALAVISTTTDALGTLACNGAAALDLGAPVLVAGSPVVADLAATSTADVTVGATTFTVANNTGNVPIGTPDGTANNLAVSMGATRTGGDPFPAGNYNFTVLVQIVAP